jgi:hypothetical protein
MKLQIYFKKLDIFEDLEGKYNYGIFNEKYI